MVAGLAGPLLATNRRLALPIFVGEILAGDLFGPSGAWTPVVGRHSNFAWR
jgi:Kef-type K+ transport system membrane component KefB